MNQCPKCGKRLRLINVSQFCPRCGVNLRFYGFRETFEREAKQAELSQAAVHVKIKRLKAALVGSPLAIARLCVMILPLVSLLVPAGAFGLKTPMLGGEYALSPLGLFGAFTDGRVNALLTLANDPIAGADVTALRNAVFVYLVPAVFALLTIVTTLLCFVSIRRMQKVICTVSGLGFLSALVSMLFSFFTDTKLRESPYAAFDAGVGLLACMLAFAVVFAINFMLESRGFDPDYAEGMLERTAIWHDVKAGKIKLEDLPQPVVETEETRKIEREIEKQKAALAGAADNETVESEVKADEE
ncbi:MAG: zinc ribbon domain-containing protein [Clostridia bacterium]|nr:zinc ribbon domain-containing protein [Clostridia bacterium]